MLEGEPSVQPIMTEADYEMTVKVVEPLLASEPAKGTAAYRHAMALVARIEAYETAQGWNPDECSDADLEAFRREQMGASADEPAFYEKFERLNDS